MKTKLDRRINNIWVRVSGSLIRADSIIEFNPIGFIYTSSGRCFLLNRTEIKQVHKAINFIKP